MHSRNIVLYIFVSVISSSILSGQELTEKKDTTALYRNIESYSRQSKLKTSLFHLIFKPLATRSGKKAAKNKGYKKLIQKPYNSFEGKIIRRIEVVSCDPFGYSVSDTSSVKMNFLGRAGNSLHVKTQEITLRNLMLIHKNDQFNSRLVKESERLVRSQNYVHDVSFYVVAAGEGNDSVDIHIREVDYWSIIPQGSVSHSGFRIGFTDKNFLGTGHEFRDTYSSSKNRGYKIFLADYFIPNFRNTYTMANLHYEADGNGYFNRSAVIDRPFFSPFAKWAAGISFASRFKKDSLTYTDSTYIPMSLKFRTQDFWVGKAIQILGTDYDSDIITNLILAIRYLRIRYSDKPLELYDPVHAYSNEDFYLGTIGISARKYVQDRYIFKYGVIEDVPVGRVLGLTAGFQVKPDSRRFYAGLQFSAGDYYQWGYLSTHLEYGTFLHGSLREQGVLTAGADYFSGLFEIGRWKLRQFVKPRFTIGMNRFPYDSLTLKEDYGLNGFNSTDLSGTIRMLFTLQTQLYAPWYLFGFRVGPFITYSVGMLGDSKSGFKKSKAYSQIGLGVLIKNDFLIFSTFQISISFYPVIPGAGHDIFKLNSYRTSDFGFRDFELNKPSNVSFR